MRSVRRCVQRSHGGRTGSLFTGRFQSVPITSTGQLIWVGRYIHRNPLDIVGQSPPRLPIDGRASEFFSGGGRCRSGCRPDRAAERPRTPRHTSTTSLTPQPSDRLSLGALAPVCDDALRRHRSCCRQCWLGRCCDRSVVAPNGDAGTLPSPSRSRPARWTLSALAALSRDLRTGVRARHLARRGRVLAAESPSGSHVLRTAVLKLS